MNTPVPPVRRLPAGALLVAAAVLALLAYFVLSRRAEAPPAAANATAPASVTAPTVPAARNGTDPALPTDMDLPPGAHYEGGILVDADGRRILNEAGLPVGPPLPQAKPIPIKAAPNDVVGYTKDAKGVVRPLRAGDLKGAANAPGTYAVVDMWAEGGPAVVPATEGRRLSDQEVARLRAEEAARDAHDARDAGTR
jgi:hypothetical protein